MDDALALCAVDLCGRPYLQFDCTFPNDMTGGFDTSLVKEFFYAVSYSAAMNIHVKMLNGENSHHMIEAVFKAFAKALDDAVAMDARIKRCTFDEREFINEKSDTFSLHTACGMYVMQCSDNDLRSGSCRAGIDVSKWQGSINWQAVAQSGVTFAFIRVGNTLKGIDEYFIITCLPHSRRESRPASISIPMPKMCRRQRWRRSLY